MYWESYRNDLYGTLRTTDAVPIYALADHLYAARHEGRTVFVCGNGGSAAAASHLVQDLSKVAHVRAISLCDNVGAITAYANDEGYETVFAEQLQRLARASDVLIAISGSGNSENVLQAVSKAHSLTLRTWGVVGFDGGKLAHLAHRCIHVPCHDMGMVETAHSAIFHWVVDHLRCSPWMGICPRFQDVEAKLSTMEGDIL